ncbi:MAG: class I SAM-dependent methyltransferase [Gammaproteobacteria bacterium]|nr:class I SAM-dependent methyltransferase [Gammaproteobacteria bacterium]
MKPFAESCEQNKHPILTVLKPYLSQRKRVLEIGSGTGQHAVFFASQFPQLHWQTSDRLENHSGILMWLEEASLQNVLPPLDLDVCSPWPEMPSYDAVYSANTAHIMSLSEVECMFVGVGKFLESGGVFLLYGPFNYNGTYTSDSNARFDLWLKSRDHNSGIKNFEDLCVLADTAGMTFTQDFEMPANNRTLVWTKD